MIPAETRHWPATRPLRFLWRTDRDGRFVIEPGEFLVSAGARTAQALGRLWPEVAATLGIDGDARFSDALTSRTTWTGVELHWPAADGSSLRVQFSGFPAFAADGEFDGYRGFALCRPERYDGDAAISDGASLDEAQSRRAPNVVPFRSSERRPTLTAGERTAFQEIARALESFAGELPEPGEAPQAASETTPPAPSETAPDSSAPTEPATTVVLADAEPASDAAPGNAAALAPAKPSGLADILARTSDAARTPLHTIIGLAELLLEQSGARADLPADYVRDIRGAACEVLALLDDLLHLAAVERAGASGVATTDLDTTVQDCVTVLQAEASRARVLIRTGRAAAARQVRCDARALRQLVSNVLGASLELAGTGGQIIVSTAQTADSAVLRVREIAARASDNEAGAAHVRTISNDGLPDADPLKLSLARALAEASRAAFAVRPATGGGTLIEVVFPQAAS